MNLPTKITVSRIIATIMMIVALFVLYLVNLFNPSFVVEPIFAIEGKPGTGINPIFLGLFVFFALASYTDHLDGKLARKNNQITDLGKFLDPVADKLLINSILLFLAVPTMYQFAGGQVMHVSIWCVIIMVVRDTVVDAMRFIAAQKGVVIAANIFGKMKTVLQMVAIIFILLNGFPFNYFDYSWPNGLHISDFFVYAATIVSFISGVIYVIQNKRVLKENK